MEYRQAADSTGLTDIGEDWGGSPNSRSDASLPKRIRRSAATSKLIVDSKSRHLFRLPAMGFCG